MLIPDLYLAIFQLAREFIRIYLTRKFPVIRSRSELPYKIAVCESSQKLRCVGYLGHFPI